MARTRVRFLGAGALAGALVLTVSIGARALGQAPSYPTDPASVRVVRAGDTLWGIARGLVGPGGDPRPLVARLREINRVEPGSLRAGMRLELPAV